MLDWLTTYGGTVAVVGLVAAVVGFAIFVMVRDRKRGGSCGCGCSTCPMSHSCSTSGSCSASGERQESNPLPPDTERDAASSDES